MKRRTLIKSLIMGGAVVSTGGIVSGIATSCSKAPAAEGKEPTKIAGMTLDELENDYRHRLFNEYLPFWEKGGIDQELGGFMCELNDDGSVVKDEKYIWYQGRGIWVYSYLFNNFGKDEKYLQIAEKARDFLVNKMYMGNGQWHESVNRQGEPMQSSVSQGSSSDIYGALFSAAGLIELYKANGNKEDLEIALASIRESEKAYNNPNYEGISVPGVNSKGLRTIGHSFMFIWTLTNLLSFYEDQELEKLAKEHVDHVLIDFWNSEYGINNENLLHDYTRIPGHEAIMYTGHYLETLWMVYHEALRTKDVEVLNTVEKRMKHLIEMTWDYVFEGMGSEDFYVFQTENNCPGPDFDIKVMWSHTELLIATLSIYEQTGEKWAKEWYERGREFCLRTMANTDTGVWRQAVDRFGKDKERPGIGIYRKGNFHQPRYQMMNILAIQRMKKNGVKTDKN